MSRKQQRSKHGVYGIITSSMKMKIITAICTTLLLAPLTGCTPQTGLESQVPSPDSNSSTEQGNTTLSATSNATASPTTNRMQATVTKVVDGDTITLDTGQTVRYIGIDTPETVSPSQPVQCYGREASAKNKELVEGKTVELEKDISETDKYDRLLRYVYIDGIFVNDYLVRQGYAHSSSYPPDIKHQDQLREAEQEARNQQRGLWGNVCNKPATPNPTAKPIATTKPITQPFSQPKTQPQPVTNTSTGGDKDCSDFSSHTEAQAYFTGKGGSPSNNVDRLDSDHDGVACESLP